MVYKPTFTYLGSPILYPVCSMVLEYLPNPPGRCFAQLQVGLHILFTIITGVGINFPMFSHHPTKEGIFPFQQIFDDICFGDVKHIRNKGHVPTPVF